MSSHEILLEFFVYISVRNHWCVSYVLHRYIYFWSFIKLRLVHEICLEMRFCTNFMINAVLFHQESIETYLPFHHSCSIVPNARVSYIYFGENISWSVKTHLSKSSMNIGNEKFRLIFVFQQYKHSNNTAVTLFNPMWMTQIIEKKFP